MKLIVDDKYTWRRIAEIRDCAWYFHIEAWETFAVWLAIHRQVRAREPILFIGVSEI